MALAKGEQELRGSVLPNLLFLLPLVALPPHSKQTNRKGHRILLEYLILLLEYLNGHNHSPLQSYACVRLII